MRHTLKRAFVLFLAFSTLGGTVHAEETPASPSPADTTPSAEPSYSENSAGKTTPSESQQPSKSLEVSSESSSSPVTSTSESDITPSLTENRAPAADPVTTVVAKIGETPYYTLKDAVDAAKDGDKVDVLADIVLGKDEMADGALYDASKYAYILFDKAGTVTIDFHEHRLEIPQQYSYDPADDSPYFAYPAMIHYIVFFINSGKLVINNGSFIGPNNFDENDPRFNGVASKQTIPSIVMAEGGQQQDRSLEFNRMQFDNWVIESGENYESYTQKATITANHSVFNQCNFGYPQISFIDSFLLDPIFIENKDRPHTYSTFTRSVVKVDQKKIPGIFFDLGSLDELPHYFQEVSINPVVQMGFSDSLVIDGLKVSDYVMPDTLRSRDGGSINYPLSADMWLDKKKANSFWYGYNDADVGIGAGAPGPIYTKKIMEGNTGYSLATGRLVPQTIEAMAQGVGGDSMTSADQYLFAQGDATVKVAGLDNAPGAKVKVELSYKYGDYQSEPYKFELPNGASSDAFTLPAIEITGYDMDNKELQTKDIKIGDQITVTCTMDDAALSDLYQLTPVLSKSNDGKHLSITIQAEKKTYSLSYDPNGGTWHDGSTGIKEISAAKDIQQIIYSAPEKDGYVLDHWEGSSYQPGDTYDGEKNVYGHYVNHSLKAVWKKEEVKPSAAPSSTVPVSSPAAKDKNRGKVVSCTEANGAGYIWSEEEKACIFSQAFLNLVPRTGIK